MRSALAEKPWANTSEVMRIKASEGVHLHFLYLVSVDTSEGLKININKLAY
jgi:hypothetical protein